MKITNIKVTPVSVPFNAPFHWSAGIYPGSTKSIIEVETDQGIVGLGEAPWWHFGEIVRNEFAEKLIGKNPLDLAEIESLCVPAAQITANTGETSYLTAFGALEIALWDIRGKYFEMPLYQLLGGAVRKEIPFTEYFSFRPENIDRHGNKHGGEMTAEAIVEYCLAMKEAHGSTFFEGKLILGDPELEIRTVKMLREALGESAMLRLDSNMQWSLPTAIRVLREIEPYNIRYYEDPVATFEEMAQLRLHSAIPFSTHVGDLRKAIALGAPDAFSINTAMLGGIRKTLKFVAACEAMGKDFWCYSADLGVCTASYLHLVAATPHIREPSQSLFRWQTEDVIQGGQFKQVNNVIAVPEGHGLGVELDRDALNFFHEKFKTEGAMSHFYDPFNPQKFRKLPLN